MITALRFSTQNGLPSCEHLFSKNKKSKIQFPKFAENGQNLKDRIF